MDRTGAGNADSGPSLLLLFLLEVWIEKGRSDLVAISCGHRIHDGRRLVVGRGLSRSREHERLEIVIQAAVRPRAGAFAGQGEGLALLVFFRCSNVVHVAQEIERP